MGLLPKVFLGRFSICGEHAARPGQSQLHAPAADSKASSVFPTVAVLQVPVTCPLLHPEPPPRMRPGLHRGLAFSFIPRTL